MPFQLPDFSDPRLERFHVVGSIFEPTILERFRGSSAIIRDAGDKKAVYQLRLALAPASGRSKERLSLEMVGARLFAGAATPDPAGTLDRLAATIEPFLGADATLVASASYHVSKADLPADGVVRAMIGIKTVAAGVGLVLIGGAMAVEKAPFEELQWKVRGDQALVSLDLRRETPLHDQVFIESLSLLDREVDRLVFDRERAADDE